KVTITFLNASGSQLGNSVSLRHNAYGFKRTDTSIYQKIAIPLSDFGVIGTLIKTIRFTAVPQGSNTFNFRMDNLVVEGSSQSTTTTSFSSGTVYSGT